MNDNKKSVYVSIYKQNLNSLKEYQYTLKNAYNSYRYWKSLNKEMFKENVERFEVQIEFYKHRIKQVVDTIKIYKYKIRDIDRNEN